VTNVVLYRDITNPHQVTVVVGVQLPNDTAAGAGVQIAAIEQMLLDLVAYRVGKKLEYDGQAGRATTCDEADRLLSSKYRECRLLAGDLAWPSAATRTIGELTHLLSRAPCLATRVRGTEPGHRKLVIQRVDAMGLSQHRSPPKT
jgi:hypothetical protein